MVKLDILDVKEEEAYWESVVSCFVLGANPPLHVIDGLFIEFGGNKGWGGYNFFDKNQLIVKKWSPDMIASKNVKTIPVWVRLPRLNIRYWEAKGDEDGFVKVSSGKKSVVPTQSIQQTQDHSGGFYCTFVYGLNDRHGRLGLWSFLREFGKDIMEPWNGRYYTWTNKQDGSSRVLSKLDRVVGDHLWMDCFEDVKCQHSSFLTIVKEGWMGSGVGLDANRRKVDSGIMEMGPKVSVEQQQLLLDIVSSDEVKAAIWSIGVSKAPGPDGYSSMFYGAAWEVIVWSKLAIPKHKFIAWLCMRNRLMTKPRLMKLGVIDDDQCLNCASAAQTQAHLFGECAYVCQCVQEIKRWLQISTSHDSIPKLMLWASRRRGLSKTRRSVIGAAFKALLYGVWGERNGALWSKVVHKPDFVTNIVKE
ncbi:LINE-1 reverse transcriptase-like protein [Bienertia sinuspersici]